MTVALNLTPVWFDYEGGTVLLNMASHRRKVDWLRAIPKATFLLMNPQNSWMKSLSARPPPSTSRRATV